jgi:hypothetical protein
MLIGGAMKRTARTVQPRLLFPIEDAPVAVPPPSIASLAARRILGAFYTPPTAADFIADWAIRSDNERVLEPSFGGGTFLRAISQAAFRKGFADVHITGIEIDPAVHARAIQEGDVLFYPDLQTLTTGEQNYIAFGKAQGVIDRYKCRIRRPWFKVPDVRTPDVIVSVFSERPLLMVNDAGYVASNSLLCGFCKTLAPESLLVRWYTSLTLLQCELEVHALGGGVIPREAGNIRLPMHIQADKQQIRSIDHLLHAGRIGDAYRVGDRVVLEEQLGFSTYEIRLMHQASATLAHWRTAARSVHSDQRDTIRQKYPKRASGR